MSCLGPKYNPNPPKEWYRYQNNCHPFIPAVEIATLLNPEASKLIPNSYKYFLPVYIKGNILQYKKNSANLTKNQRYSQIAKGMWTNRTKTWSSQNERASNPNSDLLQRVNYTTTIVQKYGLDGTEIIIPINPDCINNPANNSSSLPPRNSSSSNGGIPPPPVNPPPPIILPPKVNNQKYIYLNEIKNGGTLLGNIIQNPCNDEILQQTYLQDCYPTSDSDVPGPLTSLCWNDGLPTYYPKTKLTYGTSDNKWPTNAKFIFSANSITPIV